VSQPARGGFQRARQFLIGVVRGFAFALGLTTLIDILVVFAFTKPVVTLLARTKFFGEGHKLSGLDAAHLGVSGRKVSEIGRTSIAKPATVEAD
jgi:preprotein translocase subunit SecD